MKRTSFLRFITLFIISIFITTSFNSCIPVKPCEKNHTGDVKIINNTGYRIIVDINSPNIPGDGFMGERNLSDGSYTTYSNVPAGYIEIWEVDLYSEWGYWDRQLQECQTLNFEIYDGKGDNDDINYFYIESKTKKNKE